MQHVGVIKEIWRYPVKGMAGESLAQCDLGPEGLEGDRVWALRDSARGEIQSCKFRPELLQCTAALRPSGAVDVVMPSGDVIASDDLHIHQRLSELVGHPSTLESLKPLDKAGDNRHFYRRYKPNKHSWLDELKDTFAREPGEPLPDFSQMPQQAQDFVTLPGTFFLVSPFHIITTASVRCLQKQLPAADWDVRRFRPNVVIETSDGAEGLLEQTWLGRQLLLAGLPVDCTAAAPRCGAVTRAQAGLGADKTMLRTIVRQAAQNLGIYGALREAGTIRVGDPVALL